MRDNRKGTQSHYETEGCVSHAICRSEGWQERTSSYIYSFGMEKYDFQAYLPIRERYIPEITAKLLNEVMDFYINLCMLPSNPLKSSTRYTGYKFCARFWPLFLLVSTELMSAIHTPRKYLRQPVEIVFSTTPIKRNKLNLKTGKYFI
jgi:hypothetical protein